MAKKKFEKLPCEEIICRMDFRIDRIPTDKIFQVLYLTTEISKKFIFFTRFFAT